MDHNINLIALIFFFLFSSVAIILYIQEIAYSFKRRARWRISCLICPPFLFVFTLTNPKKNIKPDLLRVSVLNGSIIISVLTYHYFIDINHHQVVSLSELILSIIK